MSEHTAEQALTHHVALILDNDETLYHYRVALTRRAMGGAEDYLADPDNEGSPLTVDGLAVSQLADDLKDWCERLADLGDLGDLDHGLTAEVLTTALAFVDWRTLATNYLGELAEQDA